MDSVLNKFICSLKERLLVFNIVFCITCRIMNIAAPAGIQVPMRGICYIKILFEDVDDDVTRSEASYIDKYAQYTITRFKKLFPEQNINLRCTGRVLHDTTFRFVKYYFIDVEFEECLKTYNMPQVEWLRKRFYFFKDNRTFRKRIPHLTVRFWEKGYSGDDFMEERWNKDIVKFF